jgi:hypothetical protein
MARFSIGTAFGDAFGLIRDRPLSVLVWGLLLLAPVAGSFALIFPAMGDVIAAMPDPGDSDAYAGPPEAAFARMMQLQLVSMLLNIAMMLVMVVIYTAVFRSVLRPGERSAFSLRVGMDELRVAVVGLAIGVGFYAALLVFLMLGFAVGFAVWSVGDPLVLGVTIGVLILTFLGACFFGLARVSMMAPATVLYRDFAFVQGWRLAGRATFGLFGMMLLLVLMIIVIELVLVGLAITAFSGMGAFSGTAWAGSDVNPFAGLGSWFAGNWHWALLGSIPAAFLYGLLMTLSIAPFASACRQLADSGQAPGSGKPSPAAAA